jgi:hypothetical protein
MRCVRRGEIDAAVLGESLVSVRRRAKSADEATLLFIVGLKAGGEVDLGAVEATAPNPERPWSMLIDTESPRFGGTTPATLDDRRLVLAGPGAVVLRS